MAFFIVGLVLILGAVAVCAVEAVNEFIDSRKAV